MPDQIDHPDAYCIECYYDLRGSTSDSCPECGWQIDWELACKPSYESFPGTPAHHAKGWRIIDQTLLTVLIMLFTPWRFARQIRHNEAIWPALVVAVLACVISLPAKVMHFPEELVGAWSVILTQTLLFATAYRNPEQRIPWTLRARLWLTVSLYSTVFVASWKVVGPPIISAIDETNIYWPLNSPGSNPGMSPLGTVDSALIRSIVFYWWWIVLGVMLWHRNRPRWLAAVCTAGVFVISLLATWFVIVIWDY